MCTVLETLSALWHLPCTTFLSKARFNSSPPSMWRRCKQCTQFRLRLKPRHRLKHKHRHRLKHRPKLGPMRKLRLKPKRRRSGNSCNRDSKDKLCRINLASKMSRNMHRKTTDTRARYNFRARNCRSPSIFTFAAIFVLQVLECDRQCYALSYFSCEELLHVLFCILHM